MFYLIDVDSFYLHQCFKIKSGFLMFAASAAGLAGLSLARFLGLLGLLGSSGLSAFSSHCGSMSIVSSSVEMAKASFLVVSGAVALSLSVHKHLILNLEKKYKRWGESKCLNFGKKIILCLLYYVECLEQKQDNQKK